MIVIESFFFFGVVIGWFDVWFGYEYKYNDRRMIVFFFFEEKKKTGKRDF